MKYPKQFIPVNRNKFDSSIIRLISGLLITLIIIIAIMYYFNLQTIYDQQLQDTSDSLTEQVAISFEAMLKNITDSIYKVPLYDEDFIKNVKNYQTDSEYKTLLFKELKSIIYGNQYFYSAYLYFPKYDIVYNTATGYTCSLAEFNDNIVFIDKDISKIHLVDPRMVYTSLSMKEELLLSIVEPVPLSSLDTDAVLAVNVAVGNLYTDILKQIKAQSGIELYIYNEEGTILFSKNQNLLFQTFSEELLTSSSQNRKITSNYYSETLKWNFVLQMDFKPATPFFGQMMNFIIILIGVSILALLIILYLVKRFTAPVKNILFEYNGIQLREFLTGACQDFHQILQQLGCGTKQYTGYAVLLIYYCYEKDSYDLFFDQLQTAVNDISTDTKYNKYITVINKDYTAVLYAFKDLSATEDYNLLLEETANRIYDILSSQLGSSLYIGVGLFKSSMDMVPISFKEAQESFHYKIANISHVIMYSDVISRAGYYEYPYDIEKHLINKILTGDKDSCQKLIDIFFDKLTDHELILQDDEIRMIIYQLETAILRGINRLPITIKPNPEIIQGKQDDLLLIKSKVFHFIGNITEEISYKKQTNFSLSSIMEYIEKRYKCEDFNLNIAADELGLNRNYIAKIIRDHMGKSFSEYINTKRVEEAKILLKRNNLTIEDVAHQVGFNYSHYFIKIFKDVEGITPGQYRSLIGS